jgi:hypothetical protein
MFQEYPKWIEDKSHQDGGFVVFSREEEERHGLQEETEAPQEVKKRGRPKKVAE